ncbi:MAG: trypsin-like peptidase domain-containing protein [Lachnospiraceae bacterium]|nr:trypsin-like peptidase domain-containing protein [Lachnospiraceae bacterium]
MEENKNQSTPDFMKETIKQRPLNRRKLVRRTIITAAMAVIFGTIACLTFLLLEPVISNRLYPKEEPQTIVFVEEEDDEILPEDMIADESEMYPEPTRQPVVLEDEQIEQVLSEMQLGVTDYISLSASLSQLAREIQKSMVTVVGVTSDVDWFNNQYENEGVVSGVIIADNGKELLVLANINSLMEAESLRVTFSDKREYRAEIKKTDSNTGLAVLSVAKTFISNETLKVIQPVVLGSSASNTLTGSPVIALGSPIGTEGSVCFGNITSTGNSIDLPDSAYKQITTDIYGSKGASGILINLRGQVVGIIDMSYNTSDLGNLISAIGITELKKTVESLSNDRDIPYLGVHGTDVTKEANEELGVPIGAYIKEIDMDAPAMIAGIQSGDVIVRLQEEEVLSYSDLVNKLLLREPEEMITVGLMRQGPEGYTEMEVTVTLGIK